MQNRRLICVPHFPSRVARGSCQRTRKLMNVIVLAREETFRPGPCPSLRDQPRSPCAACAIREIIIIPLSTREESFPPHHDHFEFFKKSMSVFGTFFEVPESLGCIKSGGLAFVSGARRAHAPMKASHSKTCRTRRARVSLRRAMHDCAVRRPRNASNFVCGGSP